MAIQTRLVKLAMSDGKLYLILETRNDDYPGEVVVFDNSFADSTPASSIKSGVAGAVALYWQVRAALGTM